MESEIRADFRPVEPLLQRALVYAGQLREFNHKDWPHYKNREDFDRVYGLPPAQRRPLERVYQKGRDLAIHLSWLLCEFSDVGEHPTFKSFVDAVEEYVTTWPPELETTLAEAETIVSQVAKPPWAVGEMIALARRQLTMVDALREWLVLCKEAPLYRQEEGLSTAAPPRPSRLRALASKTWAFLHSPLVVALIGAGASVALAAILL